MEIENYNEVPIPPEIEECTMEDDSMVVSNTDEIKETEEDSLWQQQLVDAEKQMLQEKENGKRSIEEIASEEEPAAKKRANEFEKLWKNVNDNPSDFQAWTVLLQHVDQTNELESGRGAYDSFFSRYPYCYGYWKKYADLEKRKGTKESTLKVFKRGVQAIKLSVDLWIYYLEFLVDKYAEEEDTIREQFDKSIEDCGLEFRSDKLWDLYITWETNGSRWNRVTLLYDKLLQVPVCKYNQHWQKFQEHIKSHTPSEVLDVEEYNNLRREALAELNRSESDVPDEAPPGEEMTIVSEEQLVANHEEETNLIVSKIIETRLKIHETTGTMAKERWAFEDAIKRPYFHVKPLERSQLNAWRSYLDYEVKEGDQERTKVLFERCLIACAFYEEFWMKYIRYLEERSADEEELRSVFVRACTIHLTEKLKPHLVWAAFEEERGNSDESLKILGGVQERIDSSLEAYMLAVAIQRRKGDLVAAEEIFNSCLDKFRERDDKNYFASVVIKYARFLIFFKDDGEKALKTIQEAIEFDSSNHSLLIALADTSMALRPPKIDIACEAFKTGTGKSFPPTVRMMFAHRHLHFVTECSSEKESMREALTLMRSVQQEINKERSEMDEMAKTTSDSYPKQKSPGSSSQMLSTTDKSSSAAAVNGSSQNSANSQSYQNYNAQGYGGYNQYPQGYGTNGQYPQWGYPPNQQQGYGYNQQGWGSYSNYYGQR